MRVWVLLVGACSLTFLLEVIVCSWVEQNRLPLGVLEVLQRLQQLHLSRQSARRPISCWRAGISDLLKKMNTCDELSHTQDK